MLWTYIQDFVIIIYKDPEDMIYTAWTMILDFSIFSSISKCFIFNRQFKSQRHPLVLYIIIYVQMYMIVSQYYDPAPPV